MARIDPVSLTIGHAEELDGEADAVDQQHLPHVERGVPRQLDAALVPGRDQLDQQLRRGLQTPGTDLVGPVDREIGHAVVVVGAEEPDLVDHLQSPRPRAIPWIRPAAPAQRLMPPRWRRHHVQHAFPHLVPAIAAHAPSLFQEVRILDHCFPHAIRLHETRQEATPNNRRSSAGAATSSCS